MPPFFLIVEIVLLQDKVEATFNLEAVSYSNFKNPHLINSLLFSVPRHPLRYGGTFFVGGRDNGELLL